MNRSPILLRVLPLAAFAISGCRQILGIQSLDVADGAPACSVSAPFEDCYSGCATMDGGDPSFFGGGLQACACQSDTCSVECPVYCTPGAPGDSPRCDECVYVTFAHNQGPCSSAASSNASTPATDAIYQCILRCPAPPDSDCKCLSTRKECYDCCDSNHLSGRSTFFQGGAQTCVCANGCLTPCMTSYCPFGARDTDQCTKCALDLLVDGGCEGSTNCTTADCIALVNCLEGCPAN